MILGHVFSQGEFWKAQRSATNPIMARPQRVVSYLKAQNGIVDEFIQILIDELKHEGKGESMTLNKFQDRLKFLNLERKLAPYVTRWTFTWPY